MHNRLRRSAGLAAIALLSIAISASGAIVRTSLPANPDGTRDTAFPLGDKPPVGGTLSCPNIGSFAALTNLQVGTPFSSSARAPFTGTATNTCTLSEPITVSGDNAITEGWDIEPDGDLVHDGGETGSGSFQWSCDTGGDVVLCPAVSWSYVDPPSGDAQAPTAVAGMTCTPGTNEVTCSVRASQDPFTDEACSGVQNYDFDFGGTVVVKTGVAGICPQLTESIIGASDGTPDSTRTGTDWALSFGGAGFDDATDNFLFLNAPVTGDFKVRGVISALVSAASFEKINVHWRESLDVGAKGCWLSYQGNGRIQGKCRLTTDASPQSTFPVNLSGITLPYCVEMAGEGDDTVFYGVASADCTGLVELGRQALPRSATVQVGTGITSNSAGTNATGTIEEFAITQASSVSHTFATTSTVTFRARARDEEDNVSAYPSATISVTPEVVSSGGTYKWNPGHYGLASKGTSHDGRKNFCTEMAGLGSEWKGLRVIYYWNELEDDSGNYTFDDVADVLSHCKALGLRIAVEIWWRSFAGNNTSALPHFLIPEYVLDLGGNDTNVYRTGDGWKATIWRTNVMDRLIALHAAMGARFDSDTHFEMISTGETAGGNGVTSVSDYSGATYVAQLKRLLTGMRDSWPTTLIEIHANYITGGSNAHMQDLLDHAVSEGAVHGGPDICQNLACSNTQSQNLLLGLTGTLHDYRGEIGIVSNAEPVSFTQDMPTLYTRAVTTFGMSHIFWTRYTLYRQDAQAAEWNQDGDPEPDIADYVNDNPTTDSDCPSSLSCD